LNYKTLFTTPKQPLHNATWLLATNKTVFGSIIILSTSIKGPDNPTRQLVPIRKNKGGGGGPRSKTKMVGDNVVCETSCIKDYQRWCVTELGVKEGV